MPVVIDAGTDNQQLLADDEYLGMRHQRLSGEAYFAYIDRFVAAVEKLFPKSLLHFEDFGRGTAAQILDKYQDRILTFKELASSRWLVFWARLTFLDSRLLSSVS